MDAPFRLNRKSPYERTTCHVTGNVYFLVQSNSQMHQRSPVIPVGGGLLLCDSL